MQSYLLSQDHNGLESWPSLQEEGDEVPDGNPVQPGRVDWGNIDGGPAVGVWSCTPGHFRSYYTSSELCSILEGDVTIEFGDGSQNRCGPGDSFFVAQGETVVWGIHETVTKSFMLHYTTD